MFHCECKGIYQAEHINLISRKSLKYKCNTRERETCTCTFYPTVSMTPFTHSSLTLTYKSTPPFLDYPFKGDFNQIVSVRCMCECCFVKENVPAIIASFVVSVFSYICTYPTGRNKMQKNITQLFYIIQLRESIFPFLLRARFIFLYCVKIIIV